LSQLQRSGGVVHLRELQEGRTTEQRLGFIMNGMINVISDNVSAYRYEATSQTLWVLFRSGGLYEYSQVSQGIASSFSQPHPWRRVGKLVMAHPTRKIQ
jgi:hypothetical protein